MCFAVMCFVGKIVLVNYQTKSYHSISIDKYLVIFTWTCKVTETID